MKLQIVSGLSGSGKTIVLHVLEDLGYYCIDNLPLELLYEFVVKSFKVQKNIDKAAVGIDARTLGSDFSHFSQILKSIKDTGIECDVLFLHAKNKVVIKRFSENRRKHPLTNKKTSLAEAIKKERKILSVIQEQANKHINTSDTSIQQLRQKINNYIEINNQPIMTLQFLSFGFKYGLPDDADLIFDMRCLPNPYWEPRLRKLTGKDQSVADYIEQQPISHEMFADIKQFIEKWLSPYEQNNRNYFTVAIGCTGGQHRSVYMVERLANYFSKNRDAVIARHKELS